ncbi:MAG TPA: galactose-1-epimerase [Cytophagales bacterium]|nr:galactose-1-epimerase [Cytophagales bacterium]HAA20433.1 galactose-1-epimerase [Cytophagales bacterium]HAP60119.1 galactose-1-epimerase [Cytophagales bacterium]
MKDIHLIPAESFQSEETVPVSLFTLRNRHGMTAQITNYGGRVVSLWVPDREGNWADVVLGYDSLAAYRAKTNHYGATIGRYGNRIAGGQFELDEKIYPLQFNEKGNCLHGGRDGFHNLVWKVASQSEEQLMLTLLSPDGQMGFPGNLSVVMVYTLTEDNSLLVNYEATTDAPTPVNLTHHSYFNLAGTDAGSIENHLLTLHADHFVPTDDQMIPTGVLCPVDGTPMDFRDQKRIGKDMQQPYEPLRLGGGYDHTWVIQGEPGIERLAAEVVEPVSGRTMRIYTDEPGVQFFTGNNVEEAHGKYGISYGNRSAFCLETQHFPDSPNQSAFPSTILRPGDTYRSMCRHAFGVAH